MAVTELRELRQLRDENWKLKQLVADVTLDRHVLQEIVRKSSKACHGARAGLLGELCHAGNLKWISLNTISQISSLESTHPV